MFYIYILFSQKADKFYIGFSQNPWGRLAQHNSNSTEKFTGKFKDWELKAVFEASDNISHTMKLEKFIKNQKNRNLIINMIDPSFKLTGILAQLVRVPPLRD